MTHLDEALSAYLDGETAHDETVRVEMHLRSCLPCRRRLAALNYSRAAVRSLPTYELPPGLTPTVQPASTPRHRVARMGAAAVALAGLVTAVALLSPPPEPIQLSDLSRQVGARAALDPGSGPLKVVLTGLVTE